MSSSAEVLRRTDPRHFVETYLRDGVFPDGRTLRSFLPISFKIHLSSGENVGSAVATQGGVSVTCEVEPILSMQTSGRFMEFTLTTGDESNQQNSKNDAERMALKAQLVECERILSELATNGHLVKRDSLRTEDDRLRWQLGVKAKVISTGGPIADVLLLSLLAALLDVRLPVARLEHDPDDYSAVVPAEIRIDWTAPRRSLDVSSFPSSFTFSFYDLRLDDGNYKKLLLCSPSADVLQFCDSNARLIVDSESKILGFSYSASHSLPKDQLETMMSLATDLQVARQAAITKAAASR